MQNVKNSPLWKTVNVPMGQETHSGGGAIQYAPNSKEIEQAILSHLEALQEDSMEDYELVDARPSNLEQDAAMSKVLKFANVIKVSPT